MKRISWVAIASMALAVSALAANGARAGEWDGSTFSQVAPQGMRAWFVLPTRMVPDDADLPAPESPQPYEMRAGRNEYECAQLVVMTAKALDGVSVEFNDFIADDGGTVLPAANFKANKVGEVPGRIASRSAPVINTWKVHTPDIPPGSVSSDTYTPSSAKTVPDPLLLDKSFDLGVGLTRVWLTVHVPKDARPAVYHGHVRLKRESEPVLEVPLDLRVWNHVLPDESSLIVLADVWPRPGGRAGAGDGKPLSWEKLKPYYDDLKAHRINAAGEILPPPIWHHDEPPPDLTVYDKALKYVVEDLGFVRFRFPMGMGAGDGEWERLFVFDPPPATTFDGIWINGDDFVDSDPPALSPRDGNAKPDAPHWTRLAARGETRDKTFGAARLDHFSGRPGAWVEYAFDNSFTEPLWIYLQVDADQPQERRIVMLDGKQLGIITGQQSLEGALGFASLPEPVPVAEGSHKLRVMVDNVIGAGDPIDAVVITPDRDPNFDQLLRKRAPLSQTFKDAFSYHADQASTYLRSRNWMKKAQLKMKDEPTLGEYGRIAALYGYAGEVLPSVRRELAEYPSPMLRKSAEVWTPTLAGTRFDPEGWSSSLQPGQELWASHQLLHTLGYPSIAMRLIPWLMARHQIGGYAFWSVNYAATDPWRETGENGTFMRGSLIYPDPASGAPVDSVRWEMFREGLEDYETLRMLRTALDEAEGRHESDPKLLAVIKAGEKLCEEELPAMFRTARDFTWDPVALESVRTRAGEALSALTPPEKQ